MNDSRPASYCFLTDLAAISIQGEDAVAFLQGQTTCDVRQATAQQSLLGALCNPKGRVIATFRLLHSGDGFLLLLSRELLETVLKRLCMFVLRSKVVLADAGADWRVAGLIGDNLDTVAQQAGLALPESIDGANGNDSALIVRVPGQPPRCLLLLRRKAPFRCLDGLDAMDEDAWRRADIANGLTQVGAKLSEEFIPQMLNLDLAGAVSFQKGCYTGQEIVARTHYLGQAKRRAYRYATQAPAAPGDTLYTENQADAAGTVVNAADGELLAVVICEHNAAPLRLRSPDGPILRRLPLPYGM